MEKWERRTEYLKMDPATKSEVCPVCKKEMGEPQLMVAKSTYQSIAYKIRQCEACGSGITWPNPTEEDLAVLYAENYDYEIHKSFSNEKRKRARNLLGIILTAHPTGKRKNLLDIGCMQGYLMEEARDQGIQATGLEISPKAAKEAESKGFHVFQTPVEEVPEISQFEMITARHVLEHIAHPEAFLRKTKRLLKEDGVLCLCVPNFDSKSRKLTGSHWGWYQTPGHIYHFSTKGLISLVRRCGFEPVRMVKRGGDSLFVLITLAFLLRRQPKKGSHPPRFIINFLSFLLGPYEKIGDEETIIVVRHSSG